MEPVKFKSCNVVFAKDQPEYLPLPAHRDDDGVVITQWSVSWRERLFILFGHKVKLRMLTFNKPLTPVKLSVD